ncbi:MAG: hypothetical protein VKJ02_14585 [Snowella sp.]|nr:hypothetical protein [Snowella sp.]
MQYRILKLFFFLLIVVVMPFWDISAIAWAKTVDFQWVGEQGYSVQGSLTYSEDKMSLKRIEEGQEDFYRIENLIVSFYEPSGKKIKTYENIKNHISSNPYFQLNFDPEKETIDGFIDLGGDSAGEIYLKGSVDKNLALFKIDSSGNERIYDQNLGQFYQVQF